MNDQIRGRPAGSVPPRGCRSQRGVDQTATRGTLARPEGPGQTSEETLILAHPECTEGRGADEELDQLASFWDLVNLQDIAIVERVQAGLSDPAYRGGRLCYHFEEPLHRFQNMVIDKMIGIDRVSGSRLMARVACFLLRNSTWPSQYSAFIPSPS